VNEAIKVLIVEDHPLYRGALLQLIGALVGTASVLAVSSAEEGLRLQSSLPSVNVILLDLGLPNMSGIEALSAFVHRFPAVAILVVSASEDRTEATSVLRAGARVFISKAVSAETILNVVQRLMSGGVVQPEWITPKGRTAMGGTLLKLTPRQQETLELLAQGYSNKEIGLRLGLAEITVKVHVSAVFRALDVVNRTQAVLAARRQGLCFEDKEPDN